MIFLTYNDSFTGIYKSQVVDVCSLLSSLTGNPVKLVAFISVRDFSKQRNLIRSAYKNSSVLPMFPKARFWKLNLPLLFLSVLFNGSRKIWARGPFACNLALSLKWLQVKKVIFDSRGAYQAELNEYQVVDSPVVKREIATVEKKALEKSDAQLAVSERLVEWWREQYAFTSKNYAVIPCTLANHFLPSLPSETELFKMRRALGFEPTDVVLTYSGSSAEWQSFKLVENYLYPLFVQNANLKLIFLSAKPPKQSKLFQEFGNRIICQWVSPSEVRNVLLCADYGLLIREKSVTNQVASPVKFAEYLACGLDVIISEQIGDFSQFVNTNLCGRLEGNTEKLHPLPYGKRTINRRLAVDRFSKENPDIRNSYKLLAGENTTS